MRGPALDKLPAEQRETRLRVLVDELRWQRDSLRRENRNYRDRIERQQIKLDVLRGERNALQLRLDLALRDLARERRKR